MEHNEQILCGSTGKMPNNKLLALLLSSNRRQYYSLQKAEAILQECQHQLNKLYNTPVEKMPELYGICMMDAVRIKAAFELSNRRLIEEVMEKPKISCSRDVYQLFEDLAGIPYEEFHILILNRANKVISRQRISEGGISGTVVDPKKVFKLALDSFASSLILVHNHPSGNISPSDADKNITHKIAESGKVLEIAILDHIIVSLYGYYSFADEGLL